MSILEDLIYKWVLPTIQDPYQRSLGPQLSDLLNRYNENFGYRAGPSFPGLEEDARNMFRRVPSAVGEGLSRASGVASSTPAGIQSSFGAAPQSQAPVRGSSSPLWRQDMYEQQAPHPGVADISGRGLREQASGESGFYIEGGPDAPRERERTPEELLEALYQRFKPETVPTYRESPGGDYAIAQRQTPPELDMEAKKTAAVLLASMLQNRENQRATEAQERVAGLTDTSKVGKQQFDMSMDWVKMVNDQVKLYADRASKMLETGGMTNMNQFNEALSGYQDALVSRDQELAKKWKQRLDDILAGKIAGNMQSSPTDTFNRFLGRG